MILALAGNPYFDYAPGLFALGSRSGARFGLGATQTQLNVGAGVTAAVSLPALISGDAQQRVNAAAAVGGSTALAIMGPAMAAGPWGIAVAGAIVGIQLLSGKIAHLFTGCGQVCVQDTTLVNQADTLIQQIGSTYWNTPVRNKSFQAWTLQQLTGVFDLVQQKVGLQKSATERLTRKGGAPWCAANNLAIGVDNVIAPTPTNHFGRCGGWLDVVYDPISLDPDVVPDDSIEGAAATLGIPAGYAFPALAAALVLTGVLLL